MHLVIVTGLSGSGISISLIILDDCAIAMCNYFFKDKNNDELKVEFFQVLKNINGKLMLILHDSHLPYQS